MVQLRDKRLEARQLLERARRLLVVCRAEGVPFILNDRPDLALECGADGVHVGQDDAPPALARRIVGDGALVGLSTHSVADLEGALQEPVDYLSAGPVVPTPTKPGRPGTGLSYIAEAAHRSSERPAGTALPVFVTGGVAPGSVPELVAAGASRFVAVRYLTEAEDPEAHARRLRQAIDSALAETSG